MSIKSVIIREIMEELGIKQESIDKVQSVIENIDIQKIEDRTIISLKLKNISIVIDK